jgi:DNA-binding response OmpR family regulator
MLILVVEDDEDYAEIVAHSLRREGFDVIVTGGQAEAARVFTRRPPDMAILDVMLADGSGLDVCRQLRVNIPGLPILFLSSLNRSGDIVAGLDAGADDYVTKPFHPSELVARVRALARRAANGRPVQPVRSSTITANGLEVNGDAQSVSFNGQKVDCTPIEVQILEQLVKYPGQPLSHTFLTKQVWGYNHVNDAVLLKGHISSLRRKLRSAGASEDLVRTVHGIGYTFSPV